MMTTGDLEERRRWANKWLVKLTDEQKSAKKNYERLSKGFDKSLKTLLKTVAPENAVAAAYLFKQAKELAKDEKFGQAEAAMAAASAALKTLELSQPSARPGPESKLTSEERFQVLEENRLLLQQAVLDLEKQLLFFRQLAEADQSKQQMVQQIEHQLAETKDELLLARVDVKDPYRAALVKGMVLESLKPLAGKIDELGLDATDPNGPNLMEKLGGKLNKIIDEMLSEALLVKFHSEGLAGVEGNKGVSYSKAMEKLIKEGGESLFGETSKFAKLKDMIKLEADQFQVNMTELLEVASKDKDELARNFFGGTGNDLVGLKDLIVADSDPHNGGRRVTILKFVDKSGQEHKIVNKPRDVRVDAKFVGAGGDEPSVSSLASDLIKKTAQKKKAEQERVEERVRRLRDIFNKEAPQITLSDDDLRNSSDKYLAGLLWGPVVQLRVQNMTDEVWDAIRPEDMEVDVKPLPGIKYLSKMPDDQDGHPYGWVEYIDHGTPDDYVVDEEGAKNYYRQAGRQAAMAFLFGIEDIHQGNIMVSKGQPQLTDLEIAFSTKVSNPALEKKNRVKRLKADPAFTDTTLSDEELANLDDREVERLSEGRIKNLSVLAKSDMIDGLLGNTMMNKGLAKGSQIVHGSTSTIRDDRLVFDSTPDEEKEGLAPDEIVQFGQSVEMTDNQLVYRDQEGNLHSHVEIGPDNPRQKFGGEMLAGFQELIEAFSDPNSAKELNEFVESFKGVHVRFHALATAEQLKMRRDNMRSGFTQESTQKLNEEVTSKLKDRKAGGLVTKTMQDDLQMRDVAYYTQELGSNKLLHNGVDPVEDENGPIDYFDTDGLEPVKERIQLLTNPEYRQALLERAQNFVKKTTEEIAEGSEISKTVQQRTGETIAQTKDESESSTDSQPERDNPVVNVPLPTPPVINDNGVANPTLYFIVNSNNDYNYAVSSAHPGRGWQRVEQFCAYLAAHWLANGQSNGGLRFADLPDQQDAIDTLIEWGGSGGLAGQVQHARQLIGGRAMSKEDVLSEVRKGFPAGTRIWFGTSAHAQAAHVGNKNAIRVYDPNTGGVTSMNAKQFANYIAGQTAFVVG